MIEPVSFSAQDDAGPIFARGRFRPMTAARSLRRFLVLDVSVAFDVSVEFDISAAFDGFDVPDGFEVFDALCQ
ncbi:MULTISPECIES: hypothetical protein [unclassified Streptomyces]|uniref:hypothetical protein n=1 Tax=unclassified Streptomyces TaxID=2593676 RepID=UPI002DD7A079|nr:hypothetical protein [Streptomyces sp. NBC_00243]WRZ21091.1 hypothetical protein OHT59_22590 [Streptomyces sp. NBC_00243]